MPCNLVAPLGSGYSSTLTLQQKQSLEHLKAELRLEADVQNHPEGDKYSATHASCNDEGQVWEALVSGGQGQAAVV